MEHGNVEELIACLRKLEADAGLCCTVGERAYQTVAEKYRLSRMQSDWFGVLEKARRVSEQVNR